MYTVKQLSDLAGVTARTLHYYDEIGLLEPANIAGNGYRYYDDDCLFRLQQILFYREMDVDLQHIKQILEQPEFDRVSALQIHRQALQAKADRLRELIKTIDTTILHHLGEVKMSKKNIFKGFTPEEEEKYAKEARDLWGETARQSQILWKSYSEQRKAEILQEGSDIYQEILANMELGPGSPQIQALLARWHNHLRYFYEPTLEVLKGLGEMYNDHPDFNATFTALHPDLPEFLKNSIRIYVDTAQSNG